MKIVLQKEWASIDSGYLKAIVHSMSNHLKEVIKNIELLDMK